MVRYVVSTSYADANHDRLSQRTPIARNGQARANPPDTPVRGAAGTTTTAPLHNNPHWPHRRWLTQMCAEPPWADLAPATALKSP
jgi:hypothetical protein